MKEPLLAPDMISIQHNSSTLLNKKLGLVTSANQNQGRLAVQLDGFDKPKSLKTQNLMIIPMADKEVALNSCLPDKSQWTCMQPTLKKYLSRIPDS
jgi:hypothetical protein